MSILLFSAFLIILILLIRYFANSDKKNGLKLLTIFGILIGLTAVFLNIFSRSNFGASTPVNVQTKNLTSETLKIYSIIFWDNEWNGKGNHVFYDKKLKPNETSTDFVFENDSTKEFWVVAKNENNQIVYLNVENGHKYNFYYKVNENEYIEEDKKQIAKRLTIKADSKEKSQRFGIWLNVILITILIVSLIKIK